MTARPKISTRDWQAMALRVRNGQPFQCHGSMNGEPTPDYVYTGRLPEMYAEGLRREVAQGNVLYVIFSYSTPIAWKLRDGTVISPDTRYSVTTSQHQGKARVALSEA